MLQGEQPRAKSVAASCGVQRNRESSGRTDVGGEAKRTQSDPRNEGEACGSKQLGGRE